MRADPKSGRFALVTGAARGLGAALVDALCARGFDVVAAVRRLPQAGAPGAKEPARDGHARRYVACDLADANALEAAFGPVLDAAAAQRPRVAVLVNNAATAEPASVLEQVAAGDVARSLAVNVVAPAVLAARFCRAFAGVPGDRRIINVSSGAAAFPIAGEALYCMAKAGLEMLTRALAEEQSASGIRVITLRPGVIDTGMQRYLRSQPAAALPSVEMFRGFHASGQLVAAGEVARRTVARLVEGSVESGRTYSYAEL
jgi:NAD(P)-dependent dehydrogenase (short-subunit alcohol dehydrogenase family)